MKFSTLSLAVLLSVGSPVEILGQGNNNNKPNNGNNRGGGKSDIRKRGQAFPDPARLDEAVQAGGVQDKLNVKYKETMSERQIAKAVQRTAKKTGCSDPVRVFPNAGANEEAHVAAGLHLHYRFDCESSSAAAPGRNLGKGNDGNNKGNGKGAVKGRKAADAIGRLASEPKEDLFDDDKYGIGSVDPGYEIALVGSPAFRGNSRNNNKKKGDDKVEQRELLDGWMADDPFIGNQDHYATVKLNEAWQKMTDEGAWGDLPGVVVQVLDTGKNPDHEDLQNNTWTNPGEICGDGIDNDGNNYTDDCHGFNHADGTGTDLQGNGDHGTHCTGTIAADTDNGIGVAGVAGGMDDSPGASIMTSVGFGSTNTGGFAEAITYGADNGADISSNSWGYTSPGAYEQSVLDAIKYATDEKGVMVVVAAGNGGSDGDWYPAFYEKAIAVASTDKNKVASSFTNYGPWIDISAPGSNVYSTTGTSGTGSYAAYSGTSMACPHVAGILALGKAMSAAKGLTKTSQETLLCLYGTAEDIDDINPGYANGHLGAGMADTAAFLDCMASATVIPTAAPTVPPPTPAPTPCAGKWFKLELTTDNYPGETSWDLTDESGGMVTSGTTDAVTEKCCEAGNYTFTINDSYGDGICCAYGAGSYKIYVDDIMQHQGGEFGSVETKQVIVSGDLSPTPVPPTPQPTTSTTTTTTAAPTANPTTSTTTTTTTTLPPTNAPTTSTTTTTTTTTLPPTNAPTTSTTTTTTTTTTLPPTNAPTTTPPPPPPTASPTTSTTTTTTTPAPTPCNGKMFKFEIDADNYPSETSWDLKRGGVTLLSGNAYGNPKTMCCPPGDYEFAIKDSWGDGICCGYGLGSYAISLDGDYFRRAGGAFGFSEMTRFTVGADGLISIEYVADPNQSAAGEGEDKGAKPKLEGAECVSSSECLSGECDGNGKCE